MFPKHKGANLWLSGLPHRRGDVSVAIYGLSVETMSSPQAWGCFRVGVVNLKSLLVFPTGVGMFLESQICAGFSTRLPHRRGDVSSAGWT